jgi:tripartite-type tricarboxylate transporter receptor subunit TctC
VLPLVQAGRLRALSVTTRARSALVPNLPGMEEAGLANYDLSVWYGFFAPAGTPAEIVKRLFDATALTLQNPKLKEILARDGTETVGSRSPEDFGAFVVRETKLWGPVILNAGMKVE